MVYLLLYVLTNRIIATFNVSQWCNNYFLILTNGIIAALNKFYWKLCEWICLHLRAFAVLILAFVVRTCLVVNVLCFV